MTWCARHGPPARIVGDNGAELTSTAVLAWADHHTIAWHYIALGKPQQNGFIQSFNGRLRDELSNETLFMSLPQARTKLETWRRDYNEARPHSALRWMTPAAYAETLRQDTGRGAALRQGFAPRPLAENANDGSDQRGTLVMTG
jgi:putative transposase